MRKFMTATDHRQGRLMRSTASLALVTLYLVVAPAQHLRAQQGEHAGTLRQAIAARASTPGGAAQAAGTPQVLTLDDALEMAETRSEQVSIAEAGVTRAESQQQRVRSEWFPQLSASASYDRALASEFEGIFDAAGPPCTPFTLDPQAPLGDRVAEIERALRDCPPTGNLFGGTDGGDGSDRSLPFGRANTYRLNLAFSQNVYTGGRLSAQQARARIGRENAGLSLTSTRAQLALDVAQAYYDAVLSDRLVVIAEATLAQAESTAEQVRQQREAGRMAEFDLVRALVARDSGRPEVIRRRNARDLAYLRLKQLLELPLDANLQLVGSLEEPVLPSPAVRFAGVIAAAEAGALESRVRTAVTQAANEVAGREADVRIARSQRLPSVSVSSAYGRVAYPAGVPGFGDFRTNWTIGAAAQVPLFTGGRIKADEIAARADLSETRARLQLARELATLDEASARLELANARAAWEATAGTVQQAQRAYEIADLRYREGLSTQLELADARLLLQQAQANRAQAARDVQIARVRLALLPELPLTTPSAGAVQQAQAAVQPQTAQSPANASGAASGTGAGQTTGAATGGRTGAQRE
jgi:outer membrane protein TolC